MYIGVILVLDWDKILSSYHFYSKKDTDIWLSASLISFYQGRWRGSRIRWHNCISWSLLPATLFPLNSISNICTGKNFHLKNKVDETLYTHSIFNPLYKYLFSTVDFMDWLSEWLNYARHWASYSSSNKWSLARKFRDPKSLVKPSWTCSIYQILTWS